MISRAVVFLVVSALLIASVYASEMPNAMQEATDDVGFGAILADDFIKALRQRDYEFLTDEMVGYLHNEIEQFVAQFESPRVTPGERQALIQATDRLVPELFLHRHLDDEDAYWSQWDAEGAYRKFRDLVNTYKWQLWLALSRDPLTPEQLTRRRVQHDWLRQFVAAVEIRPNSGEALPREMGPHGIRARALENLEQILSDPLGLLYDPMTDPQFEVFKQLMQRSSANGLVSTVSDVRVRALGARAHISSDVEGAYAYPFDIALPLEDEVKSIYGGGEGSGPHLVFASNAKFRGREVCLDARNRPVFDLTEGACIVDQGIGGSFEDFFDAWEKERAVGDLAYDDATGNIVAIRGARIAALDVTNWFEADRVSDVELRRLILDEGVTRMSIVRLPPANGPRRVGQSDPRCFIVLQSGDSRLAVLDLRYREFGQLSFVVRLH